MKESAEQFNFSSHIWFIKTEEYGGQYRPKIWDEAVVYRPFQRIFSFLVTGYCNKAKEWENMMNNYVLLFSATNKETPYEQLLHYW